VVDQMRHLAFALTAALGLGTATAAPAPAPIWLQKIDATRWFATPAQEAEQRAPLIAELSAAAPPDVHDAAALLAYLQRSDQLLVQARRHREYLHLHAAIDIHDHPSQEANSALGAATDRRVLAVRAALRDLGDDAFAGAAAKQPKLGRYAHLLHLATELRGHELSPGDQALLDSVESPQSEHLFELYQLTRRNITYPTIQTPAGARNVDKDAEELANSPDRALRHTAWQERVAALASPRALFASELLGVVRLTTLDAKLHHYPDAPTQVYEARGLHRPAVEAAIRAVAARADVLRAYQRVQAEHLSAVHHLGLAADDVRAWDRHLKPPGVTLPAFTVAETRAIALQALAPLGAEYVARFSALLDPAGGRMDLATEQGDRVEDAFSLTAPGVPATLFVGQYKPSLNGARVIVHEGGHAIHFELMYAAGTSPFYDHGPNWLGEGVAIFNQLLLYDHLARTTRDPRVRAVYLEALLHDLTFEIFTSAEEGELEQAIYDGVAAGKINTADDLDNLTLATMRKYEPIPEAELRGVWVTKSLMFEDPLYLVNYMYASLVAAALFDFVHRDPTTFRARYAEFLRAGFSATPEALLTKLFGHEVRADDLVASAMRLVSTRTAELAAVYRQTEVPPPPATR
jgi:oligoendopeptidase F